MYHAGDGRRFAGAMQVIVVVALVLAAGIASAIEGPPKERGVYTTLTDEFWQVIRDGGAGQSQIRGTESGVLINDKGQLWRERREGYVMVFGRWALGISVLAIAAVYFSRGQMKIEEGRSGELVERWSPFNRFLHWYVAVLFIVLAVSGLVLLYGKLLLPAGPGEGAFSALAMASKVAHNYGGPAFAVGLLAMAVLWVKDNLPTGVDLEWLLRGGGIFGGGHPSAGFTNGGEKIWFWIAVLGGIVVSVTGFVLDFPNFGQTRELMQDANILHAIFALFLIAVFLGHLYIATLGTEGALEGMVKGKVDANWAKQHHDLWYEEVKATQTKR